MKKWVREGKAANEGCAIPEGTEINSVGKPWGTTWNLCLRGILTSVSRKKLTNFSNQILQPLLEGFSGGWITGILVCLVCHELGHSMLPRQTSGQEVQILGSSTLQVGVGWISVCLSPPFYLIEEEKEEGGEEKESLPKQNKKKNKQKEKKKRK